MRNARVTGETMKSKKKEGKRPDRSDAFRGGRHDQLLQVRGLKSVSDLSHRTKRRLFRFGAGGVFQIA